MTSTLTHSRGVALSAALAALFFVNSAGAKNLSGASFQITRSSNVEISQLEVADMNHDGELDVVSVGRFDRSLRIQFGDGHGAFSDPVYTGAIVNDFRIGYATSDTLRDIIAVKPGLGELVILINEGGGTFSKLISQIGSIGAPSSLATGYLDGDAQLDYLIAPNLLVSGDGAGGVVSTTTISVDFQTADIADLNGDGYQDLVLTCSDTLTILTNNGAGVFSITTQTALGLTASDSLDAVTRNGLSDFNRDGQVDIVVVQPYSPTKDSSRISIALGDGAGGVATLESYTVSGTIHTLTIADADGDDLLDIVGSNPGNMNELTILGGDGSGAFSLLSGAGIGEPGQFLALGKGDFNDDGNIDFVTGCVGAACSLIVALNMNPPLPIICGNMTVYGLSNIDLSVIDPAGNMISSKYTSVAGGRHELLDEDQDGILDNRISNISLMDGEYTLIFKSRYPANPGGTFSSLIRVPFREFKFFKDYPAPAPGDSLVFHYIQEYAPRTLPRSGELVSDQTPRIIWWAVAADAGQSPPYHFQLDDDYDFSSPMISDSTLTGAAYEVSDTLQYGAYYYWRYRSKTGGVWEAFSNEFAFHVEPDCCVDPGDSDDNGSVNISDVTFLISWLFSGVTAPPCLSQADANGDQKINISDVLFIVYRIFAGGPAPTCGPGGIGR